MSFGHAGLFVSTGACQSHSKQLKPMIEACTTGAQIAEICGCKTMRKRTYQYGDQSLAATFAGIIRDKDWEKKFDQHRVFLAWNELVDQQTAKCARPLKIVNDVLWVEVDNSAWVQQLQFRKLELLDALNHHLRVSYFTDLRFTVGASTQPITPEEKGAPRMVPPSSEEIARFEKQVECIEDEQIRKAMTRLWYVSQAVRRD